MIMTPIVTNPDPSALVAANILALQMKSGGWMSGGQDTFEFRTHNGRSFMEVSEFVSGELVSLDGDGSCTLMWTIKDPDGLGRGILPHYHPVAEKITILSGRVARVQWTFEGHRSSVWLRPNDSLIIPAGAPHEAWYWGNCVAVIEYDPGMILKFKEA